MAGHREFGSARQLEVERLRSDYEAWKRTADRSIDQLRAKAIETVLDTGFGTDAHSALAARNWSFLRVVLAQRANVSIGRMLEAADACAWDGYLLFGKDRPGIAPPIVCVDLIDAPHTLQRSELRAQTTALQLPVAFVPPRYLQCPWLLTTLHHEVGHVLDLDFKVTERAASGLGALQGVDADIRDQWTQWLREIVCDAFAIAIAGPAFVLTLASVTDALGQWGEWDLQGVHPPPELRIAIGASLARQLGWDPKPSDVLVEQIQPAASSALAARLVAQCEAIAHVVVSCLPSRPPAEIESDHARLTIAVSRLVVGRELADPLPIRLVPAAAQLALADSMSKATLAAIDSAIASAHRPEWASSEQQWQQLRIRVEQMDATQGVELGRKLPPNALLQRHDEIAFVGAANHQLAEHLREAFEARDRRKWSKLEVFFLTDASVREIDPRLVAIKAVAVRELDDLLATCSDQSTLREYETPYYFASYWDVDSQRADARIHVSPYVWGRDPATCPAVDYIRGNQPSQAFETYRAGLCALRERATPFS